MSQRAFQRALGGALVGLSIVIVALQAQASPDLEDPAYLKKIVTSLAAQNKVEAIESLLRMQFPAFFRTLRSCGLQRLLDGEASWSSVEAAWPGARESYLRRHPRGVKRRVLDAFFTSFKQAIAFRPRQASPASKAEARLRDLPPASRLETYRQKMYSGQHALADWSAMTRVGVIDASHELELVWFNRNTAIPELGIRPGVALTSQQKAAVVKLFGVKVAAGEPARAGGFVGTAFAPADVGRTINVESAVTIINPENGQVLPEVSIQGAGALPTNPRQRIWGGGGAEGLGTASLDGVAKKAGVSSLLQARRGTPYVALAILRAKNDPKRAIYVQGSMSVLRLDPHLNGNASPSSGTDTIRAPATERERAERLRLFQHLGERIGLNAGFGRALSPKELLAGYLPEQSGINAGIASLGLARMDGSHAGNASPAEMVDFSETAIRDPWSQGQNEAQRQQKWFQRILEAAASAGIEVDTGRALRRFARASAKTAASQMDNPLKFPGELRPFLKKLSVQLLTADLEAKVVDLPKYFTDARLFDAVRSLPPRVLRKAALRAGRQPSVVKSLNHEQLSRMLSERIEAGDAQLKRLLTQGAPRSRGQLFRRRYPTGAAHRRLPPPRRR